MKLKEVIERHHWLSIETTLLQCYPDQQKNIDGYRKVYQTLQQLPSADTAMQLQICLVEDEASGEPDYQAYCLFEMTFAGFDEKTIQGEWNEIIAASEELKSMLEAERKKHLIKMNDLLCELGEDN